MIVVILLSLPGVFGNPPPFFSFHTFHAFHHPSDPTLSPSPLVSGLAFFQSSVFYFFFFSLPLFIFFSFSLSSLFPLFTLPCPPFFLFLFSTLLHLLPSSPPLNRFSPPSVIFSLHQAPNSTPSLPDLTRSHDTLLRRRRPFLPPHLPSSHGPLPLFPQPQPSPLSCNSHFGLDQQKRFQKTRKPKNHFPTCHHKLQSKQKHPYLILPHQPVGPTVSSCMDPVVYRRY